MVFLVRVERKLLAWANVENICITIEIISTHMQKNGGAPYLVPRALFWWFVSVCVP